MDEVRSLPEWSDDDRRADALDRVILAVAKAPVIPEEKIVAAVASGLGWCGSDPRCHRAEHRGECPEPTPNELDVLALLSRDVHPVSQAAAILHRSFYTVQSQLKAVRYRLGTATTTGACCEAIRRGLIP